MTAVAVLALLPESFMRAQNLDPTVEVTRAYVAGNPPRFADLVHPGPRVVPAADVHPDWFRGHAVNHLADTGVASGYVQSQVASSTVVDFDEVEIPLVEISFGILGIVPVEPRPETVQVFVVA